MKISEKLPQFDHAPVLLAVTGEYEACFYRVFSGAVELKQTIKHIPREEIPGKDEGFLSRNGSLPSTGAVSAKGTRELNIRRKFSKEVAQTLDDMARYKDIDTIHFFAPRQVAKQVKQLLSAETKKILKEEPYGNFTKESPLDIIRRMQEFYQETQPKIFYTQAEKTILERPKTKPGL
ncbi:MAG: host attachment protein [Candidatus Moranbacteria bacterium]|nr:host attachment protein [Candidatus Moranbacteria bacterium]